MEILTLTRQDLPDVSPPTRHVAEEILALAAGNEVALDGGGEDFPEEHGTFRALDVRADREVLDEITEYVWEHRDRLGVIRQVRSQQVRSIADPQWRSLPSETDDHLHVFFSGKKVQREPGTVDTARPRETTSTDTFAPPEIAEGSLAGEVDETDEDDPAQDPLPLDQEEEEEVVTEPEEPEIEVESP